MTCDLCRKNSGEYDIKKLCCAATTSAAFRRKRTDKAGVKNAAVVVVGVTLENRQRNTTSSPVSEPGQRLRALHHQCHRDRLRHRTG